MGRDGDRGEGTPSKEQINAARGEITRCLRAKGSDISEAEPEELGQDALSKWAREWTGGPQATSWTYAERALAEFVRKRSRRAELIKGREDEVVVPSHASDGQVRRFKESESAALRDACGA